MLIVSILSFVNNLAKLYSFTLAIRTVSLFINFSVSGKNFCFRNFIIIFHFIVSLHYVLVFLPLFYVYLYLSFNSGFLFMTSPEEVRGGGNPFNNGEGLGRPGGPNPSSGLTIPHSNVHNDFDIVESPTPEVSYVPSNEGQLVPVNTPPIILQQPSKPLFDPLADSDYYNFSPSNSNATSCFKKCCSLS